MSVFTVPDPEGAVRYRVLMVSDITEQRLQRERLERQAHFDELTRLPNRARLTQLSEQPWLQAAYDLESMLVATHPEVIGELVGTDGADALAAAVIVEARQASALAAVAGKLDDLDVMLVNSAEPVSLAAATDLLAAATATTEG